ncbi:MAG: HAMP domain-containing histidine kinase [Lachnospiraceae bacterium]|nr:HAMP domain-containing histidine kinase [Lachnospiraceae bacterium]
MIRKLRTKFVILSTISLLLLLGIIVVSSNFLTYRELVENADIVLEMIAKNGGRPMHLLPPEKKEFPETGMHGERDRLFGKKFLTPEIMYEARFFTANISRDGQVISVNTQSIAMVDDDEAAYYAKQVYGKKNDSGFIEDFRYIKYYKENDIYVIFLDCGRNLITFKNALLINCLISFAGLLAIFVIIVIFSAKIVRPVSESYEKQKQFISVAGHELKTPITIIDADAEVLSMEIGEDNEWLADICKQTKRMALLTNDLLTLSRMDENRQQFTMIDFPVSDVVSETVVSFESLARSKGRHIRTEIAPMLSCRGDENSIRQVVGILLDNAIKYTSEDEDGTCEDILLRLEKKSHSICLTVRNHSEPVSDEQLTHFFDRFYRTEQSRDSGSGGYGLGLSIAWSIVEAHKGKITAAAPDLESVQITVMLPVK